MGKTVSLVSVYLVVLCLASCGRSGEKTKPGLQGRYGGILRTAEAFNVSTLYPPSIRDVYSRHVASQVYEGLVRYSPRDLSVVPGLAESWKISGKGTLYTFKIRKDAFFHDDPCFKNGKGRQVKAGDIAYALTRLCTAHPGNLYYETMARVKGAAECYRRSMEEAAASATVAGIRTPDDHTVEIELNEPFTGFIHMLASPFAYVYPEEAVATYGQKMQRKCVGTGPFLIAEWKEGDFIKLVRNPKYWGKDKDGRSLPYLDEVDISRSVNPEVEFSSFLSKELDIVMAYPKSRQLQVDRDLIDNHYILSQVPGLYAYFYAFNHKIPPFDNARVRLAFNHAIDRKKLAQFYMRGEVYEARFGVVPPAFRGYNNETLEGHPYDPEKAREYMTMAGYEGGKGFPVVTLVSMEEVRIEAEAVKQMLEDNLSIRVSLEIIPFSELLSASYGGKIGFWRFGWLADYPDPESFLSGFHGAAIPSDLSHPSLVNPFRYQSSAFDSMLDVAAREAGKKERYARLLEAEKRLLADAAVLQLAYGKVTLLRHHNVKNMYINAMAFRDFSRVYFEEETP